MLYSRSLLFIYFIHNENVWNTVRMTNMWPRDTKWANALGKNMQGCLKAFVCYKKPNQTKPKQLLYLRSAIKWGLPVTANRKKGVRGVRLPSLSLQINQIWKTPPPIHTPTSLTLQVFSLRACRDPVSPWPEHIDCQTGQLQRTRDMWFLRGWWYQMSSRCWMTHFLKSLIHH